MGLAVNILGIETSCDETAAAVVADGKHILSNIVASQIDIHARYGGIVPEVASRQHLLSLIPVVTQALEEAATSWEDLSGIAVTVGPGLIGSLLVGANFAKALALARGLPLIGINHLEAHIYANWLERERPPLFPALCLIVSGGHTDLVLMKGHGDYTKLGRTRDDAAGEAFDKAARILGLGYPGGPVIQQAAEKGHPSPSLPRAWLKGTDDFSFSGLKTALLHRVRQHKDSPDFSPSDAAAAFQESVVDVLVTKTVAAHGPLRHRLSRVSPIPVMYPELTLCTDNAAMVAGCAFHRFHQAETDLDVSASLSLT
jgi:N6-L-threonylcarbamoyladenine synthase